MKVATLSRTGRDLKLCKVFRNPEESRAGGVWWGGNPHHGRGEQAKY